MCAVAIERSWMDGLNRKVLMIVLNREVVTCSTLLVLRLDAKEVTLGVLGVAGRLQPWQRHSSEDISDNSLIPGHEMLTLSPAFTITVSYVNAVISN